MPFGMRLPAKGPFFKAQGPLAHGTVAS